MVCGSGLWLPLFVGLLLYAVWSFISLRQNHNVEKQKTTPAATILAYISSSPVAELPMPCDTSTVLTYQYACHTCLFITIPNFERTTIVRQKRLDWLGVAASLGAYFSLLVCQLDCINSSVESIAPSAEPTK
ncbi:hypothetical protein B0O99DRAFT_674930 [Bisporella sp. PMI_857]|nr:hypothetical protein B0O99DRAFT_674930 [Bisporella sp. PMI_857]